MAQATLPRGTGKNVINLRDWVVRFGDHSKKPKIKTRKPLTDWREEDTEFCLKRVEKAINEARSKRESEDPYF